MVKCPYASEGDACYNKNFKNNTALDLHIKHKHSKGKPKEIAEDQTENTEQIKELTKEELGLLPELEPDLSTESPGKPIGICSDCGADIFDEKITECPNCKAKFN